MDRSTAAQHQLKETGKVAKSVGLLQQKGFTFLNFSLGCFVVSVNFHFLNLKRETENILPGKKRVWVFRCPVDSADIISLLLSSSAIRRA